MSLTNLPEIVLDNVLERLNQSDLLSLSSTCKALHVDANRHLYRLPDDYVLRQLRYRSGMTILEYCLSLNPFNAQFVRFYQVTSISALKELASTIPLRLTEMEIGGGWFKRNLVPKDWEDFVSTMHPETYIACLKFQQDMAGLVLNSGAILPHLNVFQGLVRVELGSFYRRDDLSNIFDRINCPQLRHIKLYLGNVDWHVLPGDNLPNIETLRFEFFDGDNPLDNLMDSSTWTFVNMAKTRGIYLQIQMQSKTDRVVSFFRTTHKFAAGSELQSVLRWLVKGEHYFQTKIDGQAAFGIDIRDLKPTERDFTLQTLQNCQPQPNSYKLNVFRGDVTLAFLPKSLSQLQIAIMDEVVPQFIPTLLRSLPALTVFTIDEYGVRKASDPETLVGSSLIPYTYSIPWAPDEVDDLDQGSHQFLTFRDGNSYWRYMGWNYTEIVYEEIPDDICVGTSGLLREIKGWFTMNMSIPHIEYRVWSGYPWKFVFTESDI